MNFDAGAWGCNACESQKLMQQVITSTATIVIVKLHVTFRGTLLVTLLSVLVPYDLKVVLTGDCSTTLVEY